VKTVSVVENTERIRTGLSVEALKQAMAENLCYVQGRLLPIATRNDVYVAVAQTVRDRLLHRWICTARTCIKSDVKFVAYFSAEFLLGPQLGANLINLGIYNEVEQALAEYGLDLDDLLAHEEEPGLGNGGLGRLAACFMESLATLEIPAIGYGIRYEFGIFDQEIRDGWQVETTDKWLRLGNPWEIPRPEIGFEVKFGGRTEHYYDDEGEYRVRWLPHSVVRGVAYDTPIVGYKVNTCNTLRLWKAEAVESFDFNAFNVGDYYGAIHEKILSENITKVLYPNDEPMQGKELRLKQQYFFVSCSLQDLLRLHLAFDPDPTNFHVESQIQLNDTHPAIAVAELMRLLVDEHRLPWDAAWEVTKNSFGYTNHTLMPEALERWAVDLMGRLLPRHMEIIYEINARFLDEVRRKYPGDDARMARLSLIDESGPKYVRMANLACVGSHSINGVAELHSELVRTCLFPDFFDLYPERFNNKTNGVTPRRFLLLSNPELAGLITGRIGEGWVRQLDELRRIEAFGDDASFRDEWRRIKLRNKRKLAGLIQARTGIVVDPEALFDIQVKRLHEYKRQHLNVLHIVTLYNRLKQNPRADITPRVFIFGGKAAPGYFMAKLIIKLINSVAEVVNNDPDLRGLLKVAFIPDFTVKVAQLIYPAADLSEQISLAGKEASGTGNMKFSINGALTIGTLDGANVEIREEVGPDNFFLFGLTAAEVFAQKFQGYDSQKYYRSDGALREVIDLIGSGHFSPGDKGLFRPLVDSLLYHDEYMLFADYRSYVECQDKVGDAFRDADRWTRMSILNAARSGKFSSDRTIREYCREIWKVEPVPIALDELIS
jgi:starch phosphorylase